MTDDLGLSTATDSAAPNSAPSTAQSGSDDCRAIRGRLVRAIRVVFTAVTDFDLHSADVQAPVTAFDRQPRRQLSNLDFAALNSSSVKTPEA